MMDLQIPFSVCVLLNPELRLHDRFPNSCPLLVYVVEVRNRPGDIERVTEFRQEKTQRRIRVERKNECVKGESNAEVEGRKDDAC